MLHQVDVVKRIDHLFLVVVEVGKSFDAVVAVAALAVVDLLKNSVNFAI